MHKTDLIWGGTWGGTANFWGGMCPPRSPLGDATVYAWKDSRGSFAPVFPRIHTGAANDFVSIIYTEISCVSGGREGPKLLITIWLWILTAWKKCMDATNNTSTSNWRRHAIWWNRRCSTVDRVSIRQAAWSSSRTKRSTQVNLIEYDHGPH